MAGSLTVPNTFATQSGNVPASQLDDNWTAIVNYVNVREITIGLLSARPAAGTAGRWYLATDVVGGTLYTDNGTTWVQAAAGAGASKSMVIFNGGTGIGAGAIIYLNNADVSATEASVQMRMSFDCTFSLLRANASNVPGVGRDYNYVVRVNGASTALTCNTAGGATSGSQDLVNSVTVTANDTFSLQLTTSTGSTASNHWATMQVVPR